MGRFSAHRCSLSRADSKSKQLLSGAHTVEVTLLPSTVTRVAIDPDQALADVDRAGSVWTASD